MRTSEKYKIVKIWVEANKSKEIKAVARRAKVSLNTVNSYKYREYNTRMRPDTINKVFNVIVSSDITAFETVTGKRPPKDQEGLMWFLSSYKPLKTKKGGYMLQYIRAAVAFFADRDSIDITHLNTEQRAHVLTALLEAEEVIKEVNNG